MRELTHNIIALVHYTELTESGWCDEAFERYVVATLWELEKPVRLLQLKKGLSQRFPVSLKTHELISILEKLEKRGDIISPQDGTYHLSVEKSQQIKGAIEKASSLEAKVKSNFCQKVNASCPEISAENAWGAFLDRFLRPLVIDEGARAYDLLIGSRKYTPSLLYVDNFLNTFPKHKDIAKQILFDFLLQEDPDVKLYLLTFLDSYFLMVATGLPDKVLEEISSINKDGLEFTIFVDTNFIYSILNLHDNPSNQAANDLQELINSLSKNVHIHLAVRQDTLNETVASIRYHKDRLGNMAYPPNLAGAATQIDISGVYRAFFQRVYESGKHIEAKDYFAPYENELVPILNSKGIAVFKETKTTTEYEQMYEVSEDIELQIKYERERHQGSPKSEQQITHDVVFWHFLQDQRGSKAVTPLTAKFWIVTVDYRFLAFDKFKSERRGWLPACMHPTQLIQLLRFFVPRSSKLEDTLLGVFRFPALSREFDPKTEQICIRIMNLLSRHEGIEDIPVSTLISILADNTLRKRLSANDITEHEQIKAIQSTLASILAEKEKMLQASTAQVGQLEQELRGLSDQAKQARHNEAEEAGERKKIEKENVQIQQELTQTEIKLKQAQDEARKYKNITKWIIGGILFLGSLSAIFLLPISLNWIWLLNHNHKLGIQLCMALCVFGISWAIIDSDKKRRWFAIASIFLGAVLASTQII